MRKLEQNLRNKIAQMIDHPFRYGTLIRDILEGKGKKRGRYRLEYYLQTMKEMGCETFREVKDLAWKRVEWRGCVKVLGLYTQR